MAASVVEESLTFLVEQGVVVLYRQIALASIEYDSVLYIVVDFEVIMDDAVAGVWGGHYKDSVCIVVEKGVVAVPGQAVLGGSVE